MRHRLGVALVSEHASPLAAIGDVDAGGQNVHVAALAAALARRGHLVEVLTRRDDPSLPRIVEPDDGYAVRHIDAGPPARIPKDDLLPYMPAFSRQLVSVWSRGLPDVAHAHYWMSGLAARRAAIAVGIPLVQTFHALGVVKQRHQGAADTSPPLRIATEVMLTRQADRILATCSDEVFELRRMGLAGDRVDTVPCGVDLRAFSPEHRSAEPSRPLHALTMSRLVPRKGVDDAIRAVAAVEGVELLVAGGPESERMETDPEAARLRALARELGAADRVHFAGPVARGEVPTLMRDADVLLALPWYEPFGITPVEAAACGTPAVATDIAGHRDAVVDGTSGLLADSPAQLASHLVAVLTDGDLRARLRTGALARAAELTWEATAAAVFDGLAASARRRS